MTVMSSGQEEDPVLCHRCGAILTPGTSDLYVVRIEAFADPTPAPVDPGQTPQDIESEITRLLEEMRQSSSQELMDQVYRRIHLHRQLA